MEMSHQELKRCDLFTLQGRITSNEAPRVAAKFDEIIGQGRFHFVLDMSDVEFATSAFLGVLLKNLKIVRKFNRGDVYLAGLSPHMIEVFQLAGLLAPEKPLFRTYSTVAEAVGDW